MAFPHGDGLPRRRKTAVSRRRAMGGLALIGLAMVPLARARAGSLRPVHGTGRVPLPGMGPSFRTEVRLETAEAPGTVVVDVAGKALYYLLGDGRAYRYRISVGRQGFGWSGTVEVGAKRPWPDWRPPADMRKRDPELPESVPPGPYNPLGARALYLYRHGRDTLYRIHGTNNPDGVGFDGTSGCFRLTNTDILDLFQRVKTGAKVIVR